MVLAYILGKLEAGRDQEIVKRLRNQIGVKKASLTYGIYDLFLEVSFKNIEELDKFVFDELRKIPGVKETVTMVSSSIR